MKYISTRGAGSAPHDNPKSFTRGRIRIPAAPGIQTRATDNNRERTPNVEQNLREPAR